jgi:cyclopropane fatty-acyl-phospholipid synthase-like methyltransferase
MNKESYNQIAQWFVENRSKGSISKYVLEFAEGLKVGSTILDVGCGGGIPIAKHLLEKQFKVTGIDSSEKMIELALKNVLEAEFFKADICTYQINKTYGGIIAWDSLFHIEREKQKEVFVKLYDSLEDNGTMLFTYGGSEWEGEAQMGGASFFYSGYSPITLKETLKEIGFKILKFEVDDPTSHGHVVVLVQK